jgi:hypothetical protein
MVEVPSTPPSECYPGRPPEGRIVVMAPTRAACETIELGVQLTGVETVINREHGEEIRELARSGKDIIEYWQDLGEPGPLRRAEHQNTGERVQNHCVD